MAKVNISFRVHPWHYHALRQEIQKGRRMTDVFEEMLDVRFPVSSMRTGRDFETAKGL